MKPGFTIVTNAAAHAAEIAAITQAAFAREYGSGDGEVALIAQLRADGDVAVELAALEGGEVVGHVLFSRLAVEPATLKVAALAPVSARVDRQKSGIGSALIREGLARCRAQGFDAVAVLGDPAYYGKLGFTLQAARMLESEYSGDHFQALELSPGALEGGQWKLTYPRAFSGV
ncbi:MAG TPA: N-acetyltransferase [Rhizomicrobium sp.]|nr:N-acetyltransferase [Rhizomicrobium sp.]